MIRSETDKRLVTSFLLGYVNAVEQKHLVWSWWSGHTLCVLNIYKMINSTFYTVILNVIHPDFFGLLFLLSKSMVRIRIPLT